MKKLTLSLYFLSVFLITNNAFADNTAVSNSGALSSSNAIGTQSNNVGGFGISGASVEQQFNSKGSDIPVALPGIPGVAIPTPQNFSFGPLSNPTNINGIAPSKYFEEKCRPVYTSADDSEVDVRSGRTGNTKIVFTSYPDYKNNSTENSKLKKALPYFPATSGNYVCIGTIMTTAKKGSEADVDINVVRDDTKKYIFNNLEGYSEIYFVSPNQAIGTAVGSSTSGNGFSLGGAAAGLASGNPATAVLLGAAAAFSKSEASTHPDGRQGTTYWILGKPKNPETGVSFSEGEFADYFRKLVGHATSSQAEGNGKKLEATKQ